MDASRAFPRYCMLHIGKAGSSYIEDVLSKVGFVRTLNHSYSLRRAIIEFPNELAIFGIRHPFEIFVSGFYSRLRQGRPRYDVTWSREEEITFAKFQTPNALAEALGSPDASQRKLAKFSIRNISHTARCLTFFLHSAKFLRNNRDVVGFIFRQATLDEDIARFMREHGLPPHAATNDPLVRHANPSNLDTTLSSEARANLGRWYMNDLEIFEEANSMAAVTNCRFEPRVASRNMRSAARRYIRAAVRLSVPSPILRRLPFP